VVALSVAEKQIVAERQITKENLKNQEKVVEEKGK
jgi:hypothetical protein